MFERDVYHHYQLYCEGKRSISGYRYFVSGGEPYLVVPQKKITIDRIEEIVYFSDYLRYKGETGIAGLFPTMTNMPNANIEGESILLFKIEQSERDASEKKPMGEELALFHRNGKDLPPPPVPTESYLFGSWALLWMNRVDQAKEWYLEVFAKPVKNEFDTLFLTTFPYFEGLSENAIQYIIDYNLEDSMREEEGPSIVHERFQENSWLQFDNDYVKLPTGWVLDHPVRDIAEWIRSCVYQRNFSPDSVTTFLDEYEKVTPLKREGWRLLYGRLLFPVWYFDMIENHYKNEREIGKELSQHKFTEYLLMEEQNEAFLRSFFPMIGLPADRLQIPVVDWLIPN
ncbi:spore coat putative kinase YutH [Fictibacillus enclensis]|uniref:spore coat putative kinase YutH n=1 Tax=Fictibacillus enclensis TaxID=1017270 RepID=UPI0024C078B0|nr:spore coat protein YutH [Fictibacillus enclensis]WHY71143.1 spore coat protein YutH [Fictibacillus enclensis]